MNVKNKKRVVLIYEPERRAFSWLRICYFVAVTGCGAVALPGRVKPLMQQSAGQ